MRRLDGMSWQMEKCQALYGYSPRNGVCVEVEHAGFVYTWQRWKC